MSKRFDFSNITLKVIDITSNTTPYMFVNRRNISFSKRVLEDLKYPAYVQYCLDAEQAVFAIRVCKGSESRATAFSKPKDEQATTLSCGIKYIHEVITRLIPEHDENKRYKLEGHYDGENKVMYFDLHDAVVSMPGKNEQA